ncbi:MAG: PKD domain-containing protein [Bacteroidota bacterium]
MKIKIIILLFLILVIALFAKAQKPVPNFSTNVNSGCDLVPVSFTDLSTNSPTSWKWNFGNGQTSILQFPTIAYTPGTYTVKLVATNASGSDSITKTSIITVFQSPIARYNADIIEGCPPLTINLSDISTPGSSAITAWQWDFGNGSSANTTNTSATYNSPGAYFISLRVTDANGCVKYSINTDSVKIHPAPVVDFNSNNQASCNAPFTVNFNNLSTGSSNLTYSWNFGDGGTSALANPSHTYTATGSYNVSLTATDETNCATSITKNNYINITGTVDYHANFSAIDTTGCSSNVHFTDMSSVGAETWLWSFGDGSTSNQQNPSHSYASSGTYTVKLISTNSLSCANRAIDSIQKIIHITIYNQPTASFTMNDSTGCNAPFTVNFTSNAPTAVSYAWDFGDGGTSQQNPNYTFNGMGYHTITLTVTDIHGCTATTTRHVTMSLPNANFSADIMEGCAPLSVNFTDASNSNYPITNWNWDFGDGNNSTQQNPNHIYSDSGSYSVTLIVTDGNGCQNSITLADYIEVGLKPTTHFFADDTVVCSSQEVNFYDNSSAWVENWEWDFGDGGSAETEDPSHQYKDTGYFSVQLIVEHHGCYDTIIKPDYIYVMPPIAAFTANPISSCSTPLTTNFINTSIGAQTFEWDFGDGSAIDNSEHPTHTYTSPGLYNVTLIVTANSPEFCSDTSKKSKYIKISEIDIGYTQSDIFSCQHGVLFFNDTTTANTPIIKYIWDYGDGTVDTLNSQFAFHVFDSAGIFNITHSVIDSLGCTSTITMPGSITIQKNPEANFIADTTYGCVPLIVNFDPSNSIAYPPATLSNWQWDFGDGSAIVNANNGNIIQHVYNQRSFPNSYTPSLFVTDSKGCTNFFARPNYITPTFPFPNISHQSTICFYDSLRTSNTSTGTGLTYLWNFGDGSTSTDAEPIHFYNTATTQTYTITLTVSDSNSCDSTITSTVKVSRPIAHFYHDSITSNCPPVFVLFHDSSTTDVVSYLWNFGDSLDANNNSILEDPQHRYNKADDYTVSLTVINSDGCIDEYIAPSMQIQGPKGTINYGPKQGCAPLTVNFTATTSDANSYLWIYGNGATQQGQNTTYTYSDSGTYIPIISLTDTNSHCSFNIIGTEAITVYPRPSAYFLASNGCTNSPISFSDSSTIYQNDQITSWEWTFDDGGTITGEDVGHTYTSNGTYEPELITTTARGCKDTASRSIDIYNPIANFKFQNACINIAVAFTDSSYSQNLSIANRVWDFGDGSTSTQINPSHSYTTSGNFTVSLTVFDTRGCSGTILKTITIYPQPIAGYSNTTICNTRAANFINTSTDASGISSNSWSFGDGATSTLLNPSHIYNSIGNKTVQLITTSGNGCKDTISKIIIVNPKPTPNFTSQNTCVGVSTDFINTSTINPTTIHSWTWKFDDGTSEINSDTVHKTISTNGTFETTLIVQSDSGCIDSISKTISVFANPIADFSALPVCISFPNIFTDLSTQAVGTINNWSWSFGDGFSANTQNTNHVYASSGNQNATLTITDANGCKNTISKTVIVYPQPIAAFTNATICQTRTVNFNNTSTDASGITNSNWNFGDLSTSILANPSHNYPNSGNYNVSLIVKSGNGCLDTITKIRTVNPMPNVDFEVNNPCVLSNTEFINQSTITSGNIIQIIWRFGDGQTHTGDDTINHSYLTPGGYFPQLIARSDSGCIDTLISTITVFPKPSANFSYSATCQNENTSFTNLSSSLQGTLTDYSWNFGDSSTFAIAPNPSHLYDSAGNYLVKLTVTNSNGCINDTSISIHINFLPIAKFIVPDTLCEKVEFTIDNQSTDPIDSQIDTWAWNFGNNTTSTITSPTLSYPVHGNYTISCIAETTSGCSDTATKNVVVVPSPIAFYTAYENPSTVISSGINFTNLSTDAITWNWDFGDGDTSIVFSPKHVYADTGTYHSVLIVYNELNCPSKYSRNITIKPEFTFYIPNAFTPTGDNINENFNGYGVCIAKYTLRIYNRWGGKIFESNNQYEGWNGKMFNTGKMSPIDVYNYRFDLVDYKGEEHVFIGKVTLVR